MMICGPSDMPALSSIERVAALVMRCGVLILRGTLRPQIWPGTASHGITR